ncbi:unnamed protein product [Ambrosiozyma monospora]|uniref:Unnamed protein product n=1 Tax=Ambrosiozyma monospora TaxID=43982 RepID=A0ACB5T7L4_AMBMO|nr:unnamed protein product [Ambrosiozyma monospora]
MSFESALSIKFKLNNGIVAPAIALALAELFFEGVVKREDLFITTKVWPSMWNNPPRSVDESLKRLGLDYVDLVLQHFPLTFKADDNGNSLMDDDGQPIFDDGDYLITWKKLIELYKNGDKTDVVPLVNQVELHPSLPQVELVNFGKSKGIITEAYSRLGSGGAPLLKLPIIQTMTEKYGVSGADILINYHVKSGRLIVPRSLNVERVTNGYKSVDFSAEDLKTLDQEGIDHPKRYMSLRFAKVLTLNTGARRFLSIRIG